MKGKIFILLFLTLIFISVNTGFCLNITTVSGAHGTINVNEGSNGYVYSTAIPYTLGNYYYGYSNSWDGSWSRALTVATFTLGSNEVLSITGLGLGGDIRGGYSTGVYAISGAGLSFTFSAGSSSCDGSPNLYLGASGGGLLTNTTGTVHMSSSTGGTVYIKALFRNDNDGQETSATDPYGNSFNDTGTSDSSQRVWINYTVTNANNPNLSVSNTNFGNVRVGTSSTATVTVTNTGDSGSSLSGSIGAASGSEFSPTSGTQTFTSLDQNETSTRTFTYTPESRGSDSTSVTVSSSEDGSATATLTGTGVSPVFSSSVEPNSTIDFGMIHLNTAVLDHPDIPSTKYETITISNLTTDADLGDLTNLTILDAYITGDGTFDIIDFTPTVIGKDGTFTITIRYSTIMAHNGGVAPSQGIKNAVLTLVTDQNAAFGEAGDIFTFNLTGEVVPEPANIFLLGLAGLYSLFIIRKKNS